MNMTHVRIDDRLIHGQIITRWLAYANADMIVVADDLAAKDPLQQMLLKLVVPDGITLHILSLQDSIAFLEQPGNQQILVIFRNPKSAYTVCEAGVPITHINVGNISNTKSTTGRKHILSYIYLEEMDVVYLKKLLALGIQLEVRAVPNDKPIAITEIIKQYEQA